MGRAYMRGCICMEYVRVCVHLSIHAPSPTSSPTHPPAPEELATLSGPFQAARFAGTAGDLQLHTSAMASSSPFSPTSFLLEL